MMMIGISSDRSKHCLAVARLMYEMATEKGWTENKCHEMFLLGYVHDIGYEFCEDQPDHPTVGAKLLKNQGYKYWREVKYHGVVTDKYSSDELKMLNLADMTIDSSGKHVGAEKRLIDIKGRYGEESQQYKDAKLLAHKLGLI